MELIVSHTNADFDALASMVAASLLYPGAVMSLPGGADRNVREFLSLHGEVIQLAPPQDISLERVTRLIIVETQHARRLGRFAALLAREDVPVILYDHHTPQEPIVPAGERVIEPYGANTTLMVRELRRRDIAIDALQATLFALGIYEDTGCLTFGGTTPEDVETVAWLLRQGAKLDLVSAFMNRTLSGEQRRILYQLLAGAQERIIQGIHVLIATADAGSYIDELGLLANKMRDIENSEALLLLMQMHDAVLLVARSSSTAVNVAEIARAFGGGGHDRAASATIHHSTVAQVYAQLPPVLARAVRPRVTAAQLMSFPVRTITPETPVEEATQLMLRYGYGGLTVMEEQRVLGIISRRDADRALYHKFGHAPVRGYMSRHAVTITPQTPLPEIERLIIEFEVGRLPVLDGERLVGIVTRSDVLRALHGERYAARHLLHHGEGPRNILTSYEEHVPAESRVLLQTVAEIATTRGLTIFLVGGVVRDLLIGNAHLDFDILAEGEGIPLAEAVAEALGGHVVTHTKFHTAKVVLPDGRYLDFATARTEFYQYPAALPTAEHSSVREDLYRRDFTINAMAMQLNGEEPGRLLDPFGGSRDLAAGLIRVLHNLSFVEDPTRILRAVRFETRFAFQMDDRTEELARHALELDMLERVSGERIRAEFLQLFAHRNAEIGLRRLQALGVLAAIEPGWQISEPAPEYARLEDALAWAQREPALAAQLPEIPHQRLLLVFLHLSEQVATRLAMRLRLRRTEMALATAAPRLAALLPRVARPALRASELDALLFPLPVALALLLLALSDSAMVWERVQRYFTHSRHQPALLSGEDLQCMGVPRGPICGRIMRALRSAHLDGEISSRAEAVTLAIKMVAEEVKMGR